MNTAKKSFSLRTLLCFVLFVCLSVSHVITSRRLERAENELTVLRDQLGYLSIDDETQFHAITIDSGEELTWSWRCFFPKGYRYSVHAGSKEIPFQGIPPKPKVSSYSNVTLEEGVESLVTVRLRKADDTLWRLTVTSREGNAERQCIPDIGIDIPAEDLAWQESHSSILSSTLGEATTAVKDPRQPIVLRSFRPYYEDESKAGTGYIVWFGAKK